MSQIIDEHFPGVDLKKKLTEALVRDIESVWLLLELDAYRDPSNHYNNVK